MFKSGREMKQQILNFVDLKALMTKPQIYDTWTEREKFLWINGFALQSRACLKTKKIILYHQYSPIQNNCDYWITFMDGWWGDNIII